MSKTHWKVYQEDNTLGAWMFEDNKDIIATIKEITFDDFVSSDGKKKKKRICHFNEFEKPFVLNSTNSSTISSIFGSPYMEDWVGKKIQLYKTKVRAFGEDKDCVRIRKWKPCVCAECKKDIQAFNNMTPEQLAVYTTAKYKYPLCSDCASKINGKNKEA